MYREMAGNRISFVLFVLAALLILVGMTFLSSNATMGSVLVFLAALLSLLTGMDLFLPNHAPGIFPREADKSRKFVLENAPVVYDYEYVVTKAVAKSWMNHPEGTRRHRVVMGVGVGGGGGWCGMCY